MKMNNIIKGRRLELGYTMKEDAGRGYRRVVASPLPIDVIEKESIATLVKKGDIVISGKRFETNSILNFILTASDRILLVYTDIFSFIIIFA